jgi:hypothetical protein
MHTNWEMAVARRMPPATMEYLIHALKKVYAESQGNVAPVQEIGQRSQAFGLVGKGVFDGSEVVGSDSDGNGGDDCA